LLTASEIWSPLEEPTLTPERRNRRRPGTESCEYDTDAVKGSLLGLSARISPPAGLWLIATNLQLPDFSVFVSTSLPRGASIVNIIWEEARERLPVANSGPGPTPEDAEPRAPPPDARAGGCGDPETGLNCRQDVGAASAVHESRPKCVCATVVTWGESSRGPGANSVFCSRTDAQTRAKVRPQFPISVSLGNSRCATIRDRYWALSEATS